MKMVPPSEEDKRKRAAAEKAAEEGDEYLAHSTKGVNLLEAGRHREAAREFRKCIELDPNKPSAHYNLGNAYMASGEWLLAHHAFAAAVERHPEGSREWARAARSAFDT